MMTTATKLLLGLLGGSSSAITYLLRDEFTTDAAAPLTSPRTAEPGPGTLTLVQTDGQLSISGGALQVPAQTTPTWKDLGFYSAAFDRVAGRALLAVVRTTETNTGGGVGWTSAANADITSVLHTFYMDASGNTRFVGVEAIHTGSYAANTDYQCALVLRSAGAFQFLKGGAYTDWTLLFVQPVVTTTPLYATLFNYNKVMTLNYFRVRDLPAPFTTDFGIATLNVASPADQTEYTGDADGIIDLTVTAPGVLDGSAATRCGFYYRADSDLSPAWHCYVNGTGAFNVDSIDAAGTRTNRITAAAVIAGGATLTLRVIAAGTKHNAYTLSGTTWTKRGSEVNVSLNDTVTTIEPSIPAGWSAANLRSYPRTSAAYAELDRE